MLGTATSSELHAISRAHTTLSGQTGAGMVDVEKGNNEKCFKWCAVGWVVIKGSFKNILKKEVGKGKSCS